MAEITLDAIATLRLEPGDVLVIRTKLPLSNSAATLIREQLEHTFPGHKAIILDNDAELSLMRHNDPEWQAECAEFGCDEQETDAS